MPAVRVGEARAAAPRGEKKKDRGGRELFKASTTGPAHRRAPQRPYLGQIRRPSALVGHWRLNIARDRSKSARLRCGVHLAMPVMSRRREMVLKRTLLMRARGILLHLAPRAGYGGGRQPINRSASHDHDDLGTESTERPQEWRSREQSRGGRFGPSRACPSLRAGAVSPQPSARMRARCRTSRRSPPGRAQQAARRHYLLECDECSCPVRTETRKRDMTMQFPMFATTVMTVTRFFTA